MEKYQIIIKGHIDQRRARWFEGMEMTLLANGQTELTGMVDQAALHALLTRIRDLGMPLVLVQQVSD